MRGLLIGLLFTSCAAFSQTQDAELWTGIGLKAQVHKDLSLKYETQTRFYKNASTLKTYYNEISANYSPIKRLSFGLSYRYSRKNREDYFEGTNRICLNTSYGYKLGETNLKLKARGRYQFGFDRLSAVNDFIYPDYDHLFRLKVDLQYKNKDFKRVSPFVGYELFQSIVSDDVAGLNAYRLYLGIDFDLPKRHELAIKYIFEHENDAVPGRYHNYMIQYNYRLPSSLFKK